ncbi:MULTISPECIES: AAA family ATPase [Xanthomonas]|uniref:UDP-N-acetylglucosamine kinase n=1 Tax=Xanthomonas cucurbitae TaxID=56453 RepID=A0A2S7DK60_9XANT|nr:AAA family ATPase [Xanthomonas cucurbitae]PPU74212.1 hypothetical protein XcuCFBP2542_15965 [Xanthomonas cucurbitae]QHG87279.1 hypothetical protein EBN15_10140 [Xanthomonas cucurbitae]WDM66073.1 hypothetical protein K6981_10790 [Xanthomonas cucurbitae]WDM69952.1 hypothetical protein K6978_10765 [Xanthomonas cucurbitae]WDM73832.1 hypothetical protein K6982_10100 [Xanthomonas cucurbitae]
MGNILVLAGVNGAGKSSLLGQLLQEDGASWFNPDAFTQQLVEQGWAQDEANAQAWQEGVRRLRQAMDVGSDYAFETTLGATTIPRLLREACAQHTVAIWFCGLATVELHIERVAARVAAGVHAIAEHKIRERFDASRANLIALLPYLSLLHVYDNSAPADAAGQVAPLLVLELDRSGLQYPQTPQELAQVPDWAKSIVMAALELRQS